MNDPTQVVVRLFLYLQLNLLMQHCDVIAVGT